jgi:peptidoglycan/LPS O-acetylase OafA/YrhL
LIITVFAFNSVKNSLPWHLTYASNFYFSINDWDQYTSHFWSLSVEEQFYLFWAFLIMLLPRQYLLAAIISTILFAPLFRFMLFIMDLDNGIREYILTFSCFDSLGLGALLAFFSDARTSYKSSLTKACFWIGLPSFVLLNLLELPDNSYPVVLTFGPTAASLFFVWLTSKAAQGFGGLAGGILSFQPLVYLGKISYGIYVYHLLVPGAFNKVLAHLGLRHPSSIGLAFAFYATLTFIIAAMSWHFLELPIGALKRNFEYKATQNSR